MPTPLDLLLDPATLTILAMFAALALWERPGHGVSRRVPEMLLWRDVSEPRTGV